MKWVFLLVVSDIDMRMSVDSMCVYRWVFEIQQHLNGRVRQWNAGASSKEKAL